MEIEALVVGATGIAGRGVSQELSTRAPAFTASLATGMASSRASSMSAPTSWIPRASTRQ